MLFSFSHTDHDQNSVYGDMPYMAKQRIGLVSWPDKTEQARFAFGTALRYQYYDDNTPATVEEDAWSWACLFRTKLNWMTP
jgi:outer membrane receptor for ferrienterochelin and colicins